MVADLGASHVAVGRLARGSDGRLALRRSGLESFDSDPAQETNWMPRATQALRTIVERERWSGPVTLGVPGHLALTKFLKTPAVAKSKRDKILQFEAAQNIPYPLAEVVWDHVLVSEDEVDLELVLTATKTEAMAALSSAVEAAGVSVVRIVPAGLALRDAFRFNYPEVTASVLLVDGGARSSTLLFIEGERFSLRTVASAGNAVTEAIAEELKLEFAAAEALKCDVSSRRSTLPEAAPSREAVRRAGEQFAGRLWPEIKRTTANLQRQATLAPPARVTLDKLLSERKDRAYSYVTVTGHTDSVGSDDYNFALSQRRAEAVADYLKSHGLKAEKLTIAGRGKVDPVASNATVRGRTSNRRVEIVLTR